MFKQEIDEVIEESYLLSLPDTQIRKYLGNFLDACDAVFRRNISIWNDTRIIGIKITLLKVRLLLRNGTVPVTHRKEEHELQADNNGSVAYLAEQVVATRHMIIGLLKTINPKLSEEVLKEETRRRLAEKVGRKRYKVLMAAGYFFLLVLTAALFILFIMH